MDCSAQKLDVVDQVAEFDGSLPISQAHTPPSSWYLNEAFASAELAAIFHHSWQFGCRLDQVTSVRHVVVFVLPS